MITLASGTSSATSPTLDRNILFTREPGVLNAWMNVSRSSWGVSPEIMTVPYFSAYSLSAYTDSEKMITLSPRASCSLSR